MESEQGLDADPQLNIKRKNGPYRVDLRDNKEVMDTDLNCACNFYRHSVVLDRLEDKFLSQYFQLAHHDHLSSQ